MVTTPFHPGYLTAQRIKKAQKLKLAMTAGVGSDHVDSEAAEEAGITVAEVTGTDSYACHPIDIHVSATMPLLHGVADSATSERMLCAHSTYFGWVHTHVHAWPA